MICQQICLYTEHDTNVCLKSTQRVKFEALSVVLEEKKRVWWKHPTKHRKSKRHVDYVSIGSARQRPHLNASPTCKIGWRLTSKVDLFHKSLVLAKQLKKQRGHYWTCLRSVADIIIYISPSS